MGSSQSLKRITLTFSITFISNFQREEEIRKFVKYVVDRTK